MTELIYIGGYGRSGSTLLESLLATRPDVLACGEVVCCLRRRVERRCTCGKPRQSCEVWRAFYRTAGPLRGWTHVALTLALLDRAASRYAFMVDSSKTAWGSLTAPFKLRRKLGPSLQMLHVVRDPRGVCWSTVGGPWKRRALVRSRFVRYVRTVLGWSIANLICEFFRWLYPLQYRRIRYEDMASSHRELLQSLFEKHPLDADGGEPSGDNRHQLYGNASRYRPFELAEIREDVRWKTEMPAAERALVSALTWPLRLRYGYRFACGSIVRSGPDRVCSALPEDGASSHRDRAG